jgi:hypothetical protein
MKRNLIVTALVIVLIGGFVIAARFLTGTVVPPVEGYAEGETIRFIHPEVSDPKVADVLTGMKGSPVLVVPELAKVPDAALANVFVFTNGVEGGGPFEFQADVFDNPPGTPGYSPLRRLNLVSWKNKDAARVLTSAAEVEAALAAGEIAIEQPGVVVNIPFLSWPGGHR